MDDERDPPGVLTVAVWLLVPALLTWAVLAGIFAPVLRRLL